MRNSSRGLVLKPIPFTPGLPGLDVTEVPFKDIQQLLTELPPVPEGLTPAERGTWAHEQVGLAMRKQRGHVLVGVLAAVTVAFAVVLVVLADLEVKEREQRRAIDEQVEECLKAGRGASVERGVVTCYSVVTR